jgi:hypothetical protein
MPAPCNVIPLVIMRGVFHVQFPAGTVTVSPEEAAVTAAPTSEREHVAAAWVSANNPLGRSNTKAIRKNPYILFI